MSVLKKAYDGTLKKHPCLCGLIILAAVITIAWRLILRPKPLEITVEEFRISNWNLTEGKFNNRSTTELSVASYIEFTAWNPCYCWEIRVKPARVDISLVTPHFRYSLGNGKIQELHAGARSRRFVRVHLNGKNIPLLENSRYMSPRGSPFRLEIRTVFHSSPRSKWFWVPVHYKNKFRCQMTCSMKPLREGVVKLSVLSNQCGLS